MRQGLIVVGVFLSSLSVAVAGNVEKGKQIYLSRCAFCHGETGRGDGPAGVALKPPPANFASAEFWKATPEQQMKDAIKNGRPGTSMVPFGTSLSSEEIDDLLAVLKTFAPK